ncbi:hypothetical protein LWF15_02230 [Kineosporia rhizophila]|uniref:hypothetical protein n=1 Tax=Kineosporia rhizophila TaxID=84633 RepID=UPI001E386978|nr:hypothetical protein [Kineosporia rhizophila]MCE0534317.1 hypothetical protein [Kineosporia rhizophila]
MRILTGLSLAVLLLAGCSSDPGPPPGAEPMNDGRTQVLPLSGLDHYTVGTGALSFELPSDVDYSPETSSAAANETGAARVRVWRASAEGGSCVVIAGEKLDYRGTFPAAAIATFSAGREPGGQIEQNEPIDPVPGTLAGVRQSSRYPIVPGDLYGPQGALFVRQFLTEESTLISLNVAGPADAVESCRLEEIASTLRPGGAS